MMSEALSSLYQFQNATWLEKAMTHKSFANERRDQAPDATAKAVSKADDNERLEFLGDAVLSAALSARLMREFPQENEGSLSKRRASLVNEERLASIASRVGLNAMIRLGKGEIKTGGATKPRILACALEAYLGAIFLDTGFAEAERVINSLFDSEITGLRESTLDFERDYKTRLQEWSHEEKGLTPAYLLVDEFGPAHSRGFRVTVSLGDTEIGRGEGKSKKAAEQEAAKAALVAIAKAGSIPSSTGGES